MVLGNINSGNTYYYTLIFSSDGTFTDADKVFNFGEWETYSGYGTYTFDGTTLTLHYSDGDVCPIKITLSGNSFVDDEGCVYYKR